MTELTQPTEPTEPPGHIEVTDGRPETGHPKRWQILAICCLSLFLVVVAVSSLNIALPELQRGLDASSSELLWIVDVYALVFAGTLLPAGALGDRFGRRAPSWPAWPCSARAPCSPACPAVPSR